MNPPFRRITKLIVTFLLSEIGIPAKVLCLSIVNNKRGK